MDASVEKKLDEKKKLFMDVIRGKKPARVPTLSNVWTWKVFDAGYNLRQALYDYDVMADAVYKFQKKYDFDVCFDIGGRNPVRVLENFNAEIYHLDEAGESISFRDMDMLDGPEAMHKMAQKGYFRSAVEDILPRKYNLTDTEDAVKRLTGAARSYKQFTDFLGGVQKTLTEKYAVPSLCYARYDLPMELVFSGGLRGIRSFSIDMRRNGDALEELMNAMTAETEAAFLKKIAAYPDGNRVMYPARVTLLAHTVMNSKQFGRFCWPQLKRYADILEKNDMVGIIMTEGSIGHLTDYFQELPKDRFAILIENDDPAELRKKLPNVTIAGGYPRELLATGTKEQCVDKVKELLETVACDGRWIYSQNKMVSFRNDVKAENLLAVNEYLREHGTY